MGTSEWEEAGVVGTVFADMSGAAEPDFAFVRLVDVWLLKGQQEGWCRHVRETCRTDTQDQRNALSKGGRGSQMTNVNSPGLVSGAQEYRLETTTVSKRNPGRRSGREVAGGQVVQIRNYKSYSEPKKWRSRDSLPACEWRKLTWQERQVDNQTTRKGLSDKGRPERDVWDVRSFPDD